jgi:hypothetical protein
VVSALDVFNLNLSLCFSLVGSKEGSEAFGSTACTTRAALALVVAALDVFNLCLCLTFVRAKEGS